MVLEQRYRASERLGCRVCGQHRSTQRHPTKVVSFEEEKLRCRLRDIQAIANVKVSSDPAVRNNAIERFRGRYTKEIVQVAKENLEGKVTFARTLLEEAEEDLQKLEPLLTMLSDTV